MIETKELKHRRVQIVNMHWIFHRFESEVIGCAMDIAAAHPAASHPHCKAMVVVIPAVDFSVVCAGSWQLDGGGPSELASPDNKSIA